VYGQKLAPADIVLPSPISKGVQALWYSQHESGYCLPSAMPLLIDGNWTAVVQSRASSLVRQVKGAEVRQENVKPEIDGKNGPWPLVATRRIGNGRMVAIGLNPLLYAYAPNFDKWDQIAFSKGMGDIPSNFDVLLENSLRWTAEPSQQSGTLGWTAGLFPPTTQGDTPPINWEPKTFVEPGPWYRGHVGAQTTYSGGSATVAQWVEAARKEGLNFIVFLDDMSKMSAEKWEQLKQDCKAASGGDFRAYPGMRYQLKIATGGMNHCFVIDGRGKLPWPLPRHLTPENHLSIHQGMNEPPYYMAFNTHLTTGFMRHHDNITPYWDYKLYGLFAVLSRENGQVIDDAIDLYREQMPANVSFAPVGLEMLSSPAQLKGVLGGGRPVMVVNGAYDPRYPQLAGGMAQVDVHVGSLGEDWNKGFGGYRGWWGPAVSEGPLVSLRFRGGYTWKGVEYPRYWIERYASVEHQDWFMPSYARLPVRLDVQSEQPLAELIVYDGPAELMRFEVQGKTQFSTEFVVPQDRNRHLIAFARDIKGHRAVTMEIWTEQQQNLYNFCGDHINAPTGRGAEPGHGNAWTEGYLKMEPGQAAVAATYPRTIAGTGFESRRYQLDLVSPDVFLERASSERYFPRLMPYMSNPWHNWSEPALRDDVRHESVREEWYQLHGRTYMHPAQTGIYWDGYPYKPGDDKPRFAYYAMQRFAGQTLRELAPVPRYGFVPGLSQVVWEASLPLDQPVQYFIHRPSGPAETGELIALANSGGLAVGDLPAGSAISIASPQGFTVRAQGESLRYAFQIVRAKDRNKQDCFQANLRLGPASQATAVPGDSRFQWRMESVEQFLQEPLQHDGQWIKVARGQKLEHFVGAMVQADDHLVALELTRQPLKVNSTPLTIQGIHPHWTCGYFEPETGLYRPIGVTAQGVAYAQIDATRQNLKLVIGNVVTADHPDLRLLVTQITDRDGKPSGKWRVEAHNPTAQAITATLRVSDVFSLIRTRQNQVNIPAGTTVTLTWE
jgi:hypothetical protein